MNKNCYNCKKDGHFARNCPDPQKERNDRGNTSSRNDNNGQNMTRNNFNDNQNGVSAWGNSSND